MVEIINNMQQDRKIGGSIFILIFFSIFLFFFFHKSNIKNTTGVQINGEYIKVDLALTKESQEKGLSGKAGLGEKEGLLFVFPNSGKYTFWMKDMNFPIDMIWISEDMHLVYIKKNALPASYPETYVSDKDAKYVLEVVSGFSDKNNLKIGDLVYFVK